MNKHLIVAATAVFIISGMAATEAVAGAESKCKLCHSFDQGGKNKFGPNLSGILGKKAGSVEGYRYGDYLKNSDFTWNEENMKAWINDSKGVAEMAESSTKMASQKVNGSGADEILAFLKSAK